MKCIILGAGNVACNLTHALINNNHQILQIIGRSENTTSYLAQKYNIHYSTKMDDLSAEADIYLVAVSDTAIKSVVANPLLKHQLLVHTSGSVSIDVFKGKIENYGVFYPLQTFSKNRLVDFTNIPVCIEANSIQNEKTIENLAQSLSSKVFKINSYQRMVLHLTAVLSCNFVNHLYTLSAELLTNEKLSFEMLEPLIEETTRKAFANGPEKSQTGPALRNDKAIINKHLNHLVTKNDLKEIYQLLSDSIIRYHQTKNDT